MPIKIDSIEFFPVKITAITPTGDRPLAFALCKHWMETQTVKPDQWIVIDDGKVPMTPPVGATYVRREPRPDDPQHTLNLNLKTALPYIRGEQILIIEDDEYYAPGYVAEMSKAFDKGDVVGIIMAKYYHLPTGGCVQIPNMSHASLAQTGFKISFLPTLRELLKNENEIYLDMRIWKIAHQEQPIYLFQDDKDPLYVGIKGLPGRLGIGAGHRPKIYGNSIDKDRSILKKWIPKDYNIYLDILSGKLNDVNYNTYFPQITGITVCQNTKDLLKRAYESVRRFHPDMPIIIIDGSDAADPCAGYARSIQSDITRVIQPGYNIGHGRGMCRGIEEAKTPFALIFDSDIEMLKSPIDAMFLMMEPDTFGIGYIEHTDFGGYGIGAKKEHIGEDMPYLHPYFQLINIFNYRKFHPYVHHGAPCYLSMLDIYKRGLSNKILKEFKGLGHTAGKDYGWAGKPSEWIRHDARGTRDTRKRKGKPEIESNWVMGSIQ